MKTTLNNVITSVEEARAYLFELQANNESYHPEDDAHDIIWDSCNPTTEEKDLLNLRMEEVFYFLADPCQVAMEAINGVDENEGQDPEYYDEKLS